MQHLEQTFAQNYIFDSVDQKDFLNCFINYLNETNEQSPKLTIETIKKLGEPSTLEQRKNILKNPTLMVQYLSDGIIGEFLQGTASDCWLLSALNSLASSEEGAKILSEAITWQDDGKIKVHFAGINEDIIIDDLDYILGLYNTTRFIGKDSKTMGRAARGDIDVIIIEYAMQKLLEAKE